MNCTVLSIGLWRCFRDDKGGSLSERGVSTMRRPEAAKTGLRFLALVGFCNISYFIVYFLPYNWMATQADTFPPYPSYMRYDICGEGTPYACPSRVVTVPRKGTVAPVGPHDPRLSDKAHHNYTPDHRQHNQMRLVVRWGRCHKNTELTKHTQ